jgi:hypothetical protein
MKRATLIASADLLEREILDAWLAKWRPALAFCSENEGCGCCVDMYNVEAPEEALADLPRSILAASEWACGS